MLSHDGGALAERAFVAIERQGFHVLDSFLPPALCADLMAFARSSPSIPRTEDRVAFPVAFDAASLDHATYTLDTSQLMSTPAAQRLVSDPLWLGIAQRYLRCEPVLDHVVMWWSTSALQRASSTAAQLYHMDMDLIRFLNFFVYLTDVTSDTGPHCYVAGSHRRKPPALLQDRRFGDRELEQHYPNEAFRELIGPRGTVVMADTLGFHKGKPPVRGHRLVFQFVFTISRWGNSTPDVILRAPLAPQFAEMMRRHPRTYSAFRLAA